MAATSEEIHRELSESKKIEISRAKYRSSEAEFEKLKDELDTYKTIVDMLLKVPEINKACMKAIKAIQENNNGKN
jgi:primase-polymerase (primpol)-like protein